VRVVAATNRNLKQRVGERQFREDLYFRLSVFPIQIPPLRERGDDVLILARHFVEKFCKDLNKMPLSLSPTAIDDLKSYSWPGNVRELQNCIERAVILAESDAIHHRHLNLSFRDVPMHQPSSDPWDQIDLSGTMADALRRVIAQVERRKIELALRDARGNRAEAAHALQLGFKVLMQKLRLYGIPEA
jgi:DNA-binding NtrC family response regulator